MWLLLILAFLVGAFVAVTLINFEFRIMELYQLLCGSSSES